MHHSMFMTPPFFFASAGMGLLALAALWTIAWKAWALWLAARRGDKVWFVALLVLNTLGILEIIYIFGVAKQKLGDLSKSEAKHDRAHHAEHSHSSEHKAE